MKRLLPLLIVIHVAQTAFGQLNTWRLQNPSIQISTLNSVQMLSLSQVVACGEMGTFTKSTDGGINWEIKKLLLNDSLALEGLNFLDANLGMICGEGGFVCKTTDGGSAWTKLITSTISPLRAIVIIDQNTAVTVGDAGTILKTTDGGNTWHQASFEASSNFYTSIRMLRPDFITITGKKGLLYKSVDSGSTWQQIHITANNNTIGNDLYGQIFYSDNSAFIVGDGGGIFETSDGGNIWTDESVEHVSAAKLRAVDGKDPFDLLYVTVGEFGSIFRTSNGGNSWNHINLGIADTLNAISFFDRMNAIAVGRNGLVISTSDGGMNWNFLPSKPVTDPLYGIAFPKGDTSLGMAVGSYGAMMRTTNGGAHWDIISRVTGQNISAVTFLTSTELCAVGQNGLVLRSHDAGLHWVQNSSGTTKYLRSLSFPTPDFGWAVGDSGIVLSTTNGGSSWTEHPYPNKRYFSGITFPDSLHGYMCCDHGVYTTTDGGINWSDPDDITYYTHGTSIHSPSPNVVSYTYLPCSIGGSGGIYAVLPPGGIMTSHDAGKNWFNKDFNDNSIIFGGIFFSDDMHGTAVGHGGPARTAFIVHTTDGGMTWVTQPADYGGLNNVSFGTNKAANAVGAGGLIIRRTTDE